MSENISDFRTNKLFAHEQEMCIRHYEREIETLMEKVKFYNGRLNNARIEQARYRYKCDEILRSVGIQKSSDEPLKKIS